MTAINNTASDNISDLSDDFEIVNKSNESLCNVSAETYLTLPEDVFPLSSVSELVKAIENCKSMILSKAEDSEEKKWLVRRIIELRIRLENIKENNGEITSEDNQKNSTRVVLGHHFILQNYPKSTSHCYCDRCSGIIWNVLHTWYLCSDCEYKCHLKCLSYICRVCAHIVVSEKPEYITQICPEPENGLANQNYRCAECLVHTSVTGIKNVGLGCVTNVKDLLAGSDILKARLCDYTGKYYCSTCHWNSTSVIPARAIFNWDFKERIVCRSSKQILKLMSKLPILKLEELNPVLFACIEELINVKDLRHQLIQIKKYLTSCKSAVDNQLLWQLGDKLHFLENEDTYSLQDLLDLRSGELIKYLNKIRDHFTKHIQVECEVCKGKGFFCELCKDKKIIFPFEENVISCKCQSSFHFFCWVKNNQECPKCYRIQQRSLRSQTEEISNVDS